MLTGGGGGGRLAEKSVENFYILKVKTQTHLFGMNIFCVNLFLRNVLVEVKSPISTTTAEAEKKSCMQNKFEMKSSG